MAGIYLHIPFCRQACSYCDFYFVTRTDRISDYVDALCAEIRSSSFDEPITTVYFGGGTPSRLPIPDLARIIDTLVQRFDLSAVEEITLEANPDDIQPESLAGMKALGITRLSLGVQSFQPERLAFMNRAHSAEQAHQCLDWVNEAGFATWTADLIYGNPGQTLDELDADIDALLGHQPPHVSAYALTIEPRTRLGKQLETGRLTEVDDAIVAAHMDRVSQRLTQAGLARYEVSNFAKPGHESKHNARYWTHTPYVGLGPAAHSFDGARRWSNVRDLAAYVASGGLDVARDLETLTTTQMAEERLMMGLRTREGLSRTELRERYRYGLGARQEGVIRTMVAQGWMDDDSERIRLTASGYALADAITLRIITEDASRPT
jgi:oxygen-independent coproporphyrinogen-3 oxidase